MVNNKVTTLFGIKYPLIQGGMIWASGWRLASAVSNAGGLGILGSGSMYPDVLLEHIQKCKKATDKPFAVNVPLLYPNLKEIMEIIVKERIKIVFTSAGNPKTWTPFLKENGITVAHLVSSVKFALKSEEAGVDALVAEGFEAGGHLGREESTTLTLIPQVRAKTDLPLVAAGGIATGSAMFAAMSLGADGVQMGTRFVMTPEASSHPNFKNLIKESTDGETLLTLKDVVPTRLLRNPFFERVMEHYRNGGTREELVKLIGRARPKKGMFEGDMEEGELQIGQISGLIDEITPVAELVEEIMADFYATQKRMGTLRF